MEFLDPGFLLAAPLALLLWFGPLAARDSRHGVLRTAAVLLVVLALARPVTRTEDASAHQVVVLDRTESVTAEATAAAFDAARSLAEGLESGATLHLVDVAPAGAEELDPGRSAHRPRTDPRPSPPPSTPRRGAFPPALTAPAWRSSPTASRPTTRRARTGSTRRRTSRRAACR